MDDSDIIFTPRTGDEMIMATRKKAPIYLYSDVCQHMKRRGAVKTLSEIFSRSLKNLLLLQKPDDPSTGHWTSLSMDPAQGAIYFFSSYGGKPDEEKNKWLNYTERIRSRQETDPLNDGLKEMCKLGWKVHYNEIPYQEPGDGTATCGIWTAAFLESDMNPTQFFRFIQKCALSATDLYRILFAME